MKILLTGHKGQLGTALTQALAPRDVTGVDLPELDITDRTAVFTAVAQPTPDLILHCAALTDVDGCARNPALAYRVNGLGTQNVALAAQEFGAEMLHISSNEVFAGDQPEGYDEWAPLNPVNGYGRSKAAAEFHVTHLLSRFYIVRLSWLFAPGGRNFIHAILNRARETGQLRVVTDEVANPTYVNDLAAAITQLIDTHQYGVYHLTNAGACSRWEFANEILRQAGLSDVVNTPIQLKDFQRASTPPPYAALNNNVGKAIGIELRPWPDALAHYLNS